MTEQITDYSEFIINNNGRNSLQKNNNTQDKDGLYKAMWDVFCKGTPDMHATQKWENVLNGRYHNSRNTIENGKMKFLFQDGTNDNLNGFKQAMTEILTNGKAPGPYGGKRRSSKRRGGKKRVKKSRRNTSRVR